ncbi:MAG TPA: 5'-nucleotidase, lipoprotein e(P4) family [Bacteroidales bacterium]|nr:5'-nucleotidase, lipoprotein e(P4) family [Bacteroidales bacterium]
MKNLFYLIIVCVLFTTWACNCDKNKKEVCCEKEIVVVDETSEFLLNATLWVQTSAEFRACCYQSFNYAKLALDNNLKVSKGEKPAAVVLDIDETVLDNSYFEAFLILEDTSYTKENWKEWSDKKCATAIPGAIDFLNYAISKNVEIVYISNRRENETEATLENMKNLGFPEVKPENFYCRTDESSKDARRAKVAEKYNIILLIGDNLADFDSYLDDRTENYGFDRVDELKDQFGSFFIILPNPMYGNWEKPLVKDENKTSLQNKIDALIGYDKVCK